MEIKVLGLLEAVHNGVSITPSARKPRQILSLLALRAGQLVTVRALVDELWEANPPRSAIAVVQTYIMKLRRCIDGTMTPDEIGGAKQTLVTLASGYMLNIAPVDVDANRFLDLASAGERAIDRGDDQAASRLLTEALAIWRGPALSDVSVGALLGIDVARLEQSRLSALTSRIDVELRLGRHQHVLTELAELNARYPLHEKLCAQYMTALQVSGCTWRALEVFRAFRRRLVDELGIEPSARLQYLQNTILNAGTDPDQLALREALASR